MINKLSSLGGPSATVLGAFDASPGVKLKIESHGHGPPAVAMPHRKGLALRKGTSERSEHRFIIRKQR